MGYECLLGDAACTVTMLQTSLKTGGTVALCDEHEPMAYIAGLAASLGVDTDRLYEAIQRFVDREAKKATKELEAAQAAEAAGSEGQADAAGSEGQADAAGAQDAAAEHAG